MDTVYMICAIVGGTLLVLQTILLLLGGGGDVDVDMGVDMDVDMGVDMDTGVDAHADIHDATDSFLQILSFKTLVAFLAFFGLVGMWGQSSELQPGSTLLAAFGAGSVALLVVGYLMAGLARLQSSGNLDLHNAVGRTARVYLRVPGRAKGRGKVHLQVQQRRVECKAVTRGDEIPTGALVQVVDVAAADVLEVQHLETPPSDTQPTETQPTDTE